MTGHGTKFPRKKGQAIAALLSNHRLEEVARTVGISFKTLKRWMRLPEFEDEYLLARRDVVVQTNARIQQNSGAAASVMLKLMADPATPASVRARTAQCILEQANESLDREDILVRIRRLEETARNKKE